MEGVELLIWPIKVGIRNRKQVREDDLLIDERIVVSTQLRQTVLESIYLTHSESSEKLDLRQRICSIWFPHIHCSLVKEAQNFRKFTEQGKNVRPLIRKQQSFQMEPVIEPHEEDQISQCPSQTN